MLEGTLRYIDIEGGYYEVSSLQGVFRLVFSNDDFNFLDLLNKQVKVTGALQNEETMSFFMGPKTFVVTNIDLV